MRKKTSNLTQRYAHTPRAYVSQYSYTLFSAEPMHDLMRERPHLRLVVCNDFLPKNPSHLSPHYHTGE